jgi:hypothetical protein
MPLCQLAYSGGGGGRWRAIQFRRQQPVQFQLFFFAQRGEKLFEFVHNYSPVGNN